MKGNKFSKFLDLYSYRLFVVMLTFAWFVFCSILEAIVVQYTFFVITILREAEIESVFVLMAPALVIFSLTLVFFFVIGFKAIKEHLWR